ncbi:hypothetical protein GAYE_SCF29G4838 [Galdieria yellowstonensis]|uniref:Signal recognition particle subunit SRP19 n=1 Tax=Galdieria yellowstonensis TaxID=3028027 RepID=A0AAV9IHV8_9RHOD|nr:hypothetical protein GAYE_SCF29G4838 [Galdieria yellowstonensis]
MFAEDNYEDRSTTPEYAKRWICIYPVYIDATCSLFQGRKISKHLCSESPNVEEIASSCSQLGFKILVEPNKKHPRDHFRKGRVRVNLYQDEHRTVAVVPNIEKRKQLWAKVSQCIIEQRMKQGSASAKGNKTKRDKKERIK